MRLTPCHDRLAAEAAVGTDPDLDLGPPETNLLDHSLQFLRRTGRGINIGRAKASYQYVLAADDVQW